MKVQNNNFTLFTLYFKSQGKDRCCAVQIYIYIYIYGENGQMPLSKKKKNLAFCTIS